MVNRAYMPPCEFAINYRQSFRMFAKASPERRTARALRALLERVPSGGALPETIQLLVVLGGLEHFIPQILAEVYPYWKGESLDGFFLSDTKKLGEEQAELRGVCILISDQAITPFHIQIHLSPLDDEIDQMVCHLGSRGNGAGGMERVAWSQWRGHTRSFLQDPLKPIDWVYQVTR
jgi:hypothetical protein